LQAMFTMSTQDRFFASAIAGIGVLTAILAAGTALNIPALLPVAVAVGAIALAIPWIAHLALDFSTRHAEIDRARAEAANAWARLEYEDDTDYDGDGEVGSVTNLSAIRPLFVTGNVKALPGPPGLETLQQQALAEGTGGEVAPARSLGLNEMLFVMQTSFQLGGSLAESVLLPALGGDRQLYDFALHGSRGMLPQLGVVVGRGPGKEGRWIWREYGPAQFQEAAETITWAWENAVNDGRGNNVAAEKKALPVSRYVTQAGGNDLKAATLGCEARREVG
jgi:hypothetical protein